MSKQYNLSTTEDNGQSVTTSETVTEHPEEILRLMKLAGLENAQVVAEDDSVFEPTPANDKLDLDDYSKNSPESIAKQKKTIQPTLGDNPLEYSLDENEIQEALTKDFDEMEEGWGLDLVKGIGRVGKRGLKRLSRLGSKNTKDKYDGKGGFIGTDTTWNENEEVTEELTAGQKKLPPALQKSILAKQGKKDEAVEETTEELDEAGYDDHIQRLARKGKPPVSKNTGNLDLDLDTDSDFDSPVTEPGVFVSADDDDDRDWRDTIKKKSESIEEDDYMLKRDPETGEYDPEEIRKMQYQQNVSDPLNRDIEASQKAMTIEVDYDLELDKKKNNPLLKRHHQLMKKFNVFISMPEWQEGPKDSGFGVWTAKVRGSKKNLLGWLKAWEYDYDKEQLEDMGLGESVKTVEENLEKAQEQINELKEGCSCGCGSDCNCGPECGCGCNAVNEDQDRMAKLAGLNERGATRPMNFAGTKDHRIKGDTSKSGPEVDTLKHVDKIQKLAWNKAKAKPSHHDSSSKQAKIDIIMPKKRDTVAIKGDSTKASPHTKASKIDIKGDSSKANPNAKEPKIGIKGDSSKSKLRGEDLDRLRKLSGIQEKGSAKNPSTDPALDDLSQSFDWPEDGPKIDIDNMGKMLKVTVKEPKGTKGSTLNYDDRIQRLARKKDTGKMTPPKGDLPLSLKARVGF
jgi:hypothetical protein